MRRDSTTCTFSDSFRRRLNMYKQAASAAGVGMLALAQPAGAKIVYTPTHVVVPRGWPGTYFLDLNHDGVADIEFENWWNNDPDKSVGFLAAIPAKKGNGVRGYTTGFFGWASAIRAGVKVGPSGRFISARYGFYMDMSCYGPWNDVKNRYLGVRFTIKGSTHYGWARMNVNCNPGNFQITPVLTGYAYETIPNKPIIAGKTKGPDVITVEAGSLGALAQGSAGLAPGPRKESTSSMRKRQFAKEHQEHSYEAQ